MRFGGVGALVQEACRFFGFTGFYQVLRGFTGFTGFTGFAVELFANGTGGDKVNDKVTEKDGQRPEWVADSK